MDQPDLYATLGVTEDASPDALRRAYRNLARLHHPDLSGGSADVMVAINAAWAVLGDNRRRRTYDTSRRPHARAPERDVVSEAPVPAAPRSTVLQVRSQPVASGSPGKHVLDFGRFAGYSFAEVASLDPDYLSWLERTPAGRQFRTEIERARRAPQAPVAARDRTASPKIGFRRRR